MLIIISKNRPNNLFVKDKNNKDILFLDKICHLKTIKDKNNILIIDCELLNDNGIIVSDNLLFHGLVEKEEIDEDKLQVKLSIKKIQSSINSAIPLWESQMVIAIQLLRQKGALAIQKSVTQTTNNLIAKNGELLTEDTLTLLEKIINFIKIFLIFIILQ